MKKILKYGIIYHIAVYIVMFILVMLSLLIYKQEWYTTTDIASYGIIKGNGNNRRAEELFAALFPAEIHESFRDVTYSYKATNVDAWDFEIYLEFVIEDESAFREYVNSIAPWDAFTPFDYDENYAEYIYADYYDTDETASGDTIGINCAEIAKVLVNTAEQRIITVALGVHDGGGASTDYFTRYFDRFAIDPMEYAERPPITHKED